MNQFFPVTDNFLLCFYIKLADIMVGVIDRVKAFSMERNQIVDAIYLIQREVWVYAVRPRRTGNKPAATDTTLEFVTIERIGPVHVKLKIIVFIPFPMAYHPCGFL